MDAEPAPITIEAPAPPNTDAAPPSPKTEAAPPSPKTEAAPPSPKAEAAPPLPKAEPTRSSPSPAAAPANGRASAAYFAGETQVSDAEFAAARSSRSAAETEIGIGTFLVSGATPSGVVGAAPFFSREASPGFIVRPAVSIAGTEAAQFHATWTAARIDACWRIPPDSPVQLDLCGGAELGFAYVASGSGPGSPPQGRTLATFDLGPTAALRSAIGRDVAVSLRTGAGINAVRGSYRDGVGAEQQAPLVSGRFELALSWLFR